MNESHTKKAVTISLIFHAGFLALLSLIALFSSCSKNAEQVHVFELLGDGKPIGDPSEQPSLGGGEIPQMKINTPQLSPLKKIEIEEEFEPEPPSPKKIETPKDPEITIKDPSFLIPSKKEKKKKEKISYEDFLKKHKKSDKNEKKNDKKKTDKKVSDSKKIAQNLNDALTKLYLSNKGKGAGLGLKGGKGGGGGTGGSPNGVDPSLLSAMDLYYSRLFQAIRMRWDKPNASPGGNLTAKAEFTILPNGQIINVKIMQSSGNKEFDNSVIRACSMGIFEKTIDGRNSTFTVTLKETEE